jgi:hypothetical protein
MCPKAHFQLGFLRVDSHSEIGFLVIFECGLEINDDG